MTPTQEMRRPYSRWRAGLAAIGTSLLALGVPIATGSSPALAQGSSIAISPTQGPTGAQVTATGSGWTAGDHIQAIWDGGNGPNVGNPVVVGGGGGFTLTFTVPSNATPGNSYQVAFEDTDQRYFEVASQTFTVTTPSSGLPPAPYNVKVVPYGPLDFLVTWSDNATTLGQPFQVYNGVTTQTVTNTPPYQYVWHVSQPNTYMCFAVRAYNSSGYSAWGGMWTCTTTPAGGAPTAPTNVTAAGISTTAIKISFVNQADNETAFLFYNGVSTRVYNSYVEPAKGSTFAVTWTGLQPHTWMCFKVAAYNQWGTSAYIPSTWACAWTQG